MNDSPVILNGFPKLCTQYLPLCLKLSIVAAITLVHWKVRVSLMVMMSFHNNIGNISVALENLPVAFLYFR